MHETFVWDVADIDPSSPHKFGGKATGLSRMSAAGVSVPPAFVLSTDAFHEARTASSLSAAIRDEVERAIARLEKATGRRFGGDPALLVSVRSGAQVSMPGMMDTILNLGLDARAAHRLAERAGDVAFALDTWMRFWAMYTDIVLGGDGDAVRLAAGGPVQEATRAGDAASFALVEHAVTEALAAQGLEAPTEPRLQLERAILAIFRSWDCRRARTYREHHRISDAMGTTVTVQAMVFGNLGVRSGTGVVFTRNPNTGESALYGEFLRGRQGEDLVSGAVSPVDLGSEGGLDREVHAQLTADAGRLERLYGDALDIEITVEAGKLYFLQVRPAKRTAPAAVRIAVDLVTDGVVSSSQALRLVSPAQVQKLLQPTFDPVALSAAPLLARGVGSSPGNASGVAILDADRAAARAATGEAVVLLRPTTSPLDIRGMLTATAIVTARGGALSHAAVVSRALDKPCVVGCEDIGIDTVTRTFRVGERTYAEGTELSVDGVSGHVHLGRVAVVDVWTGEKALEHLLGWADERSRARVWPAARTVSEARAASALRLAGHGVVALADLFVSGGATDPVAATAGLLSAVAGAPVDIRLPTLGATAALTPSGEVAALVRGLAHAAESAGNPNVTVLLAGVTSRAELTAFAGIVRASGSLHAGAVVDNLAALEEVCGGTADLGPLGSLWIDAARLVRTTHGYADDLPLDDEAFDAHVARGLLPADPRDVLRPSVERLLATLFAASSEVRRGVSLTGAASAALISSFYRLGCRNFSTSLASAQGTRLLLGQVAPEVLDHG